MGKSIILAETPIERARLFQKYVMGTPEEIRSSFHSDNLATWILRLLSHVRGVRRSDIPSLLVNTFGGYSASLKNPEWIKTVEAETKQLVSRLLNSDLAVLEGEILHLTLLGRACATSSLSFESSLRLVELMSRFNMHNVPAIHVIGALQVLSEADAVYTPVMKRGRSESVRLGDVRMRYGTEMLSLLQLYVPDELRVWQRCKRAALVWDWLEGVAVDDLERRYSANPYQGTVSYGDITRITENTRFHLRSAHQILTALFPERLEFLTELDELLVRLEYGLPRPALGLLRLPVQLTRGQYLNLHRVGCSTIEDVLGLSQERLVELVGLLTAEGIAKLNNNEIEG